jgi:hypothetical protein
MAHGENAAAECLNAGQLADALPVHPVRRSGRHRADTITTALNWNDKK